MDIYLDTNMLLVPAQERVDIFSEIDRLVNVPYTIKVLRGSVEELNSLSRHSQKLKRQSAMALRLIKTKHLKIAKAPQDSKTVDDALLALAGRGSSIVATQDYALKRRLRAKQVPIITLRKKQHLILVE